MAQVYNVLVERDPETGWLVGSVVEVPGCATLEANMREALEVYLETTMQPEPFC